MNLNKTQLKVLKRPTEYAHKVGTVQYGIQKIGAHWRQYGLRERQALLDLAQSGLVLIHDRTGDKEMRRGSVVLETTTVVYSLTSFGGEALANALEGIEQ